MLQTLFCPQKTSLRYEDFLQFLLHGKFPELRTLWKKACLIFSKSNQEQEINLQPFQIFKTTRSVFHFTLEIGNSFENAHRKIIVARNSKYSQGKMKHAPRCWKI